MNLLEAEVLVSTALEIEKGSFVCDWLMLSDYGDMDEFYNECCKLFPNEENPVFRYLGWENIPDNLIREDWFFERFFDIREACDQLDEEETDYFMTWCKYHGYNLVVDDPYQLVALYQDNHSSSQEDENGESNIYGSLLSKGFVNNLYDAERFLFTNENY